MPQIMGTTCSVEAGEHYPSTSSTWEASGYGYAGRQAGYFGDGFYHTFYIKITTPKFVGVSSKIDITVAFARPYLVGQPTVALKFGLSSSNVSKNYYINGYGWSTDPNLLYQGSRSITVGEASSGTVLSTFSIPSTILQPNTTYYLYFWSDNAGTENVCYVSQSSSSAILYFTGNAIKIYSYPAYDWYNYQIYIYNNGWNAYKPYIYNGSSWVEYG